MANILIGTSGYQYHEWAGVVYPEGTKKKDYLSCYAGLFPTLELNYTYLSVGASPTATVFFIYVVHCEIIFLRVYKGILIAVAVAFLKRKCLFSC